MMPMERKVDSSGSVPVLYTAWTAEAVLLGASVANSGKNDVRSNDGHHDGNPSDPIIVNKVRQGPLVSVE